MLDSWRLLSWCHKWEVAVVLSARVQPVVRLSIHPAQAEAHTMNDHVQYTHLTGRTDNTGGKQLMCQHQHKRRNMNSMDSQLMRARLWFRLIHNIWVLHKLFYAELCLSVLQLVAVRAMGPTDLRSFWNVSSNRGFSSAWCSVVDLAHTHTHTLTLSHTH